MSNIVIVESKNDAIFMKAMVKFLSYDIQIEPPIYIDYECLEGLSETKLITTLKALEADLQKREIE